MGCNNSKSVGVVGEEKGEKEKDVKLFFRYKGFKMKMTKGSETYEEILMIEKNHVTHSMLKKFCGKVQSGEKEEVKKISVAVKKGILKGILDLKFDEVKSEEKQKFDETDTEFYVEIDCREKKLVLDTGDIVVEKIKEKNCKDEGIVECK